MIRWMVVTLTPYIVAISIALTPAARCSRMISATCSVVNFERGAFAPVTTRNDRFWESFIGIAEEGLAGYVATLTLRAAGSFVTMKLSSKCACCDVSRHSSLFTNKISEVHWSERCCSSERCFPSADCCTDGRVDRLLAMALSAPFAAVRGYKSIGSCLLLRLSHHHVVIGDVFDLALVRTVIGLVLEVLFFQLLHGVHLFLSRSISRWQ